MNTKRKSVNVQNLTLIGLLSAIVIILQLFPINIGSIAVMNTSLIPIVLGAVLIGPMAGGWLGLVSACTILFSGQAAFFFEISQIGTVLTVILKGFASGFVSGIVFRLFKRRKSLLSVILSALVCPIVNTGIYVIGCFLFFYDQLLKDANGGSVIAILVTAYIGLNFVFEFFVTVVMSPAIHRLCNIGKKMISNKSMQD